MHKFKFAVDYHIDAKGTIVTGTVHVAVADNTRWDVVYAAAQAIMLDSDIVSEMPSTTSSKWEERSLVLPIQIGQWVLNYMRDASYVYCVTDKLTCKLTIPISKLRALRSTDVQICMGKYVISQEGLYL